MSAAVTTRRASAADLPEILELARAALGWTDVDTSFLEWKHLRNSFGESPMWVAEADRRVVGFRTFLRWEFTDRSGAVLHAVRAVDTATAPDFQGQGIFRRLTLGALDELRDDGVDFVFNTPNEKSLPGYLDMGWHQVGRLPVVVRPNRWHFPLAVIGARRAASRDAIDSSVGVPAADALRDHSAVEDLLSVVQRSSGIATHRTPQHLVWRYGNPALGYRIACGGSLRDGCVVFRFRRRGAAAELVVCDVIVPQAAPTRARELLAAVAKERRADYLIRLACDQVATRSFVPVPRAGPVLAYRPLDDSLAPALHDWTLTMGDVELF